MVLRPVSCPWLSFSPLTPIYCGCPSLFRFGQFGAVSPHCVFPSVPRLSGGPSASKIFLPILFLGFSYQSSFLHAQSNVIF
jgi:hypothetical protein